VKQYRKWLLKRRVQKAIWAIKKVDDMMKKMEMPRTLRRQIWRDFIKSDIGRKDMINILERMRS
jgi:hypothetical protein